MSLSFFSTRRESPPVSLSEALSAGLAPDGGLYIPEKMPTLDPSSLRGLHGVAEVASRLIQPFFEGDRLEMEVEAICHEALNIDVPLRELDENTWLMELFHGPSAAFKDFGARFLASAMSRLQAGEEKPLTILVATSGDTGGAVAAAFHEKPGVEVVILYPRGRVSQRQAHQLGCWGANIQTLAVSGDFDACQEMVKAAFVDPACNRARRLSSANSINIGRLLPQMSYHAAAALQKPGSTFVVPTGNLGNALAALWARRVGLPIGDVLMATNENDTLVRLQQTGILDPHPTRATPANAMDVSKPSNLERLLERQGPLWDGLMARSVGNESMAAMLGESPDRYGTVVCPHTAIALVARQQVPGPAIVAATAHPAKFDSVVEPLIGRSIAVPPALAASLARPAAETEIDATLDALRDVLER